MDYIILDLEWNQSAGGRNKRNKEIPFEIIEIGAIKMDDNYNIIGEFNQLIHPKVYHDMHKITGDLIHIQMEDLERGKPFEKVIVEFLDWCGDDYMFCTWGPLDLMELQRNMRYYGQPVFSDRPFKFLDLQKIFGISFENKNARHTLEYAVDFLNIEKDIPFHRAFSDAYYTAKVFEKCPKEALLYVSFDIFTLPPNKNKEIHMKFPDYYKYISREFKTKRSAIGDREVMSTKCYLCGKATRRKIKWFTPNNKHYYSVSVCEQHGFLKGKVRIRKSEAGLYYVIKTMRLISEEQVKEIMDKKEQAKQQNKIQK
jgi:DNA polymerase III epsilon subunit-like protein